MTDAVTAVGRSRVKRWFFINVGLFMILLNIVGFAPSIVDPSARKEPLPLTSLVAAHGLVAFAFLLVFLAQATLVATGRRDIHRRLGVAGAVLALAFVVLGCLTVIEQARRGYDLSGDLSFFPPIPGVTAESGILSAIIFPLIFGTLVAAALCFRHRSEIHKRLMLLAVLGLAGTPILHLIGHTSSLHAWFIPLGIVTSVVYLSVSAIYDLAMTRRIHLVSLWVPVPLFVVPQLFNFVLPTAAWQSFSAWLVG